MAKSSRKKLGELLIDAGVVSKEECAKALCEQGDSRKRLGELLVEKKMCTEHDIATALSTQLGIEFVDLKVMPIEPAAVEIIPERLARKHLIVPVSVEDKDLYVAMHDPFSYEALEDAQFATGYRIRPYISTKSDIVWAIKKHYNLKASLESVVEGMASHQNVEVVQEVKDEEVDIRDLKKQSSMAPIIRMVNLIISEAVEQKASDIHLDPTSDELIVRYRIDGFLRRTFTLPKWVQGAVISRMKIMARMDIAEKRLPQDGRISVLINKSVLDLRVSTLPTKSGEKVVIRVLDTNNRCVTPEQLGLGKEDRKMFLSLIHQPQGILLVTGPTGSGKTTTLYAALSRIQSEDKNIITVEEPIEYELEGISQVAVNEKIGLTFSHTLRSILRQDPDVVMVGEMRDFETATIAMQASLTGHLVLSTLHTNNAVATITRLRNLGIPSYLIASTINGIIAQRLVRVICPSCKKAEPCSREELAKLGAEDIYTEDLKFFRGTGCPNCAGVGFRGRTGIYEVILLTQNLKDLIADEASESVLRRAAASQGMKSLLEAGIEKVLQGITTMDELLRVTCTDQDFGASMSTSADSGTPDRPAFQEARSAAPQG
jgi:type IV pilus assembly protein PilB